MTYAGNSTVSRGYYLSTSRFAVEVVDEDGGRLPGQASARYLKVPFLALFLIVPVIGLAFLVLLPVVGFAFLLWAIARRVTGHVAEGASDLAASVAPRAATGAAYLAGQAGDEKPAAEVTPELRELEKKIGEKRSE